jgi:DNA polymerase-3 subunit alpha
MRESKNTSQVSLFGDENESVVSEPQPPRVEPWDTMTQLSKEKEVVGMYISGHPLDDFSVEIKAFCSKGGLTLLQNMEANNGRELKLAGTVVEFNEKIARSSNKPFGTFKMEDYEAQSEFVLFGEDYLKYKHLLFAGAKLFIVGRIQPRRFGQETNGLEFRTQRIEPLFEIREKLGRYLDITIALDKLNDLLIEKLAGSLNNGAGKTQVRMRLLTDEGELKLPANAFNRVSISSEALNTLAELDDIEFAVSES